jgi:hypothetical protein
VRGVSRSSASSPCDREGDLVAAIASGAWPETADGELRAHVEACTDCQELAGLVVLMHDDRDDVQASALLPSAGQVWWRAELRARYEAAQRVQRPMTIVQAVAAAAFVGVLLAFLGIIWPLVTNWAVDASLVSGPVRVDVSGAVSLLGRWGSLVVLAIGLWVVAAPVAVYFLMRDDRR